MNVDVISSARELAQEGDFCDRIPTIKDVFPHHLLHAFRVSIEKSGRILSVLLQEVVEPIRIEVDNLGEPGQDGQAPHGYYKGTNSSVLFFLGGVYLARSRISRSDGRLVFLAVSRSFCLREVCQYVYRRKKQSYLTVGSSKNGSSQTQE